MIHLLPASIQKHTRPTLLYCTLLLILAAACRQEKLETTNNAFSLSDTMLAKCTFHKAQLEDVRNELRLFGKISPDNNKLAQVYPVVGGAVMEIHVELGDYVRQGQILATMRSSEVAKFQKKKMYAINDVAVAEKNLQVAQDLFVGKLNSERDVLLAEKDLEKAKAALERIEEIYKIYSIESGSVYNVVAPISGFVVTKNITNNEQIRSDNTEPLFAIAEINEVWALANVNESDIANVNVGHDAEIRTIAFPNEPYYGKIDKIFNAIDPETKSMKVRVKIPNASFKLKPEMNCTVGVRYSEGRKMISVPSSSVIFDKGKSWVMVFKDRHNIETRKVSVYRELGDTTYLDNGLAEGETVISKNALLIYDALND